MKHLIFVALITLIPAVICTDIGTRENPIPMGKAISFADGWEIKVVDVIPNANKFISEAYQFNKAPAAGHQYFLAKIELKNNGSEVNRLNPYDFDVVGNSSVAYHDRPSLTYPDPISWTTDVFPGGKMTRNVVWQIESQDAGSLTMYYNNAKPYVFFSLAK